MKIKNVVVEGFGPIDNVSFEFQAPGLNVILGENESGKSSFCAAISAILYGFQTRREAEQRRSWLDREQYRGRLELVIDGCDYTIERSFENDHVTVTRKVDGIDEVIFNGDANPRGRTEEPVFYKHFLNKDLGLPTEAVFTNSAFVGQMQLEIKLDEELRRQISGAGQADYRHAREILRTQHYSLTRDPLPGDRRRHKDQIIETLETQLSQLNTQLEEALEAAKKIAALNQIKEALEADQFERRQRQDDLQARAEALGRYLALEERREKEDKRLIDNRARLEEHARQIDQLEAEVRAIEEERNSGRYLAFQGLNDEELNETGSRLKRLKQVGTAVRDLEREMGEKANTSPVSPNQILWFIPVVFCLVAGTVGALVGPSLLVMQTSLVEVIIGAAIIGLIGGVLGLLIPLFITLQYNEWVAKAARLGEAKRELEETRERLKAVLTLAGKHAPLDVLIERCSVLQTRLSELSSKQGKLQGLRTVASSFNATINDISYELQQLQPEMGALEKKYPDLQVYKGNREKGLEYLGKLRSNLDTLQDDLTALQDKIHKTEIDLVRAQQVTRTDPPAIKEEIAQTEQELKETEARRDALVLAIEVLDEAIREYEEANLQWLAERTSQYFNTLTEGRYSHVEITEGENLFVNKVGVNQFTADLLSTGTKDQLFLALRLAILDLLASGVKLPVILDDTFVNLDRNRLAVAKDTVKVISRDRQVLLLSHSTQFEEWADSVLVLE